MFKMPTLFLCTVILSACAVGQYQWVDGRGQGQAMFNAAHAECSSLVRSRPVGDPATERDRNREEFIRQNSSLDLGSMSARAGLAMGNGINGLLGREDPRVSEANSAYVVCMSRLGFQRQFVSQ